MYYILTTGSKGFVKILDNEEFLISSDYTKATQFPRIGDAMREIVKINPIIKNVNLISIG